MNLFSSSKLPSNALLLLFHMSLVSCVFPLWPKVVSFGRWFNCDAIASFTIWNYSNAWYHWNNHSLLSKFINDWGLLGTSDWVCLCFKKKLSGQCDAELSWKQCPINILSPWRYKISQMFGLSDSRVKRCRREFNQNDFKLLNPTSEETSFTLLYI